MGKGHTGCTRSGPERGETPSLHSSGDRPAASGEGTLKAVRLLLATVFSIGIAEAGMMAILGFFPHLSRPEQVLLDSLGLILLIVPLLFLFLFRPLLSQEMKRKEDAERLRRQNAFLQSVIDSLPHPFYVIDANDYTIKIANKSMEYAAAPQGLTCHALTHKSPFPCNGGEHPCPLEEVKKTKKPVVSEHIHYDYQGNARNFEVYGYPIVDDRGNVVQMIESSLDITERKRAADSLRKSEQTLQDFLDNASDLIQSVAPDGKIVYVNRAWRETLGYSEEDIVRLSIFDVIHPDSRGHCMALLKEAMQGKPLNCVEVVFMTADGRSITAEGNISIRYEGGVPLYTRGIFRDITERKHSEKLLREEREFSRNLIHFSAVPTFVIDSRHRVLIWNRACEELTGMRADDVVGTDIGGPFTRRSAPVWLISSSKTAWRNWRPIIRFADGPFSCRAACMQRDGTGISAQRSAISASRPPLFTIPREI